MMPCDCIDPELLCLVASSPKCQETGSKLATFLTELCIFLCSFLSFFFTFQNIWSHSYFSKPKHIFKINNNNKLNSSRRFCISCNEVLCWQYNFPLSSVSKMWRGIGVDGSRISCTLSQVFGWFASCTSTM